MYKLLLCWRYLRTRFLALVCIISVLLGVATLIVVNSVMSGFSTKLRERLHGLCSDVDVEAYTYDGFADPADKIARIRQHPQLKDKIEAITATMEVFAMLQYRVQGQMFARPVRLIGIDASERAKTGGFTEYLVRQKNVANPAFDLSDEGKQRYWMNHNRPKLTLRTDLTPRAPGEKPPPEPPPEEPDDPPGCILGFAIAHMRKPDVKSDDPVKDIQVLHPGDEVILTTVSGERLSPVSDSFVICDYFKSEMSEYDGNFVFVPIDRLQKLRTMEDRVSGLQLRLKNYDRDKKEVKAALATLFPSSYFQVVTWEEKQGPLLAAISIEKGILNVLLFLIIAVAGFGILAIFSMIVVEKTRDIGILKALGASNGGVMKIFLSYGFLLGLVGAGLGTIIGLTFTNYINEIEWALGRLTGQDIFDRKVYYFDHIPYHIDAFTVVLVNVGSIAIAVMFSVLPALRAAMLHPVRALRYE